MATKIFITAFLLVLSCTAALSQISVIGELSHDNDAHPGEHYEGVITVKNDSPEPQEVKVYQTDYLFSRDGTNNYADPGTIARSNAKWVSFSPSYLTIPPQSSASINYSVVVPADSPTKKLIGSYWSMLMIQGIAKGSAESATNKDPKKSQMGISQTIRYGIQIATHIAQTGTKKINFADTKLVTKDDGKRYLQVDVENVGEVFIRPAMYVELFNDKGVSVGKFPGAPYRIYPGTSIRQMIEIGSVAAGTYKALVVVDAGGEDVYGAEYTLKF